MSNYCHGIMGKRKYNSIRKANQASKYNGTSTPNYIPYQQLATTINNVDIDDSSLHDIHPSLTYGLSDDSYDPGNHRSCDQYILRLATFYIMVNKLRVDKLKTFPNLRKSDPDAIRFDIAFGGDGAPIVGLSYLISFLNVGRRVASSYENFLVFGADVDEQSPVSRRFVLKFISDIKFLESKVHTINVDGCDMKVEFHLMELPNDMKMLAFLAGELRNASHYFCTFANVNKDDANTFTHSFGIEAENHWSLFPYAKRLRDANQVVLKKEHLDKKKIVAATKRSNLTKYISKELHSRQEEVPLVGQYVDFGKCEPLHLKNNTVKEMFIKVYKICVSDPTLT